MQRFNCCHFWQNHFSERLLQFTIWRIFLMSVFCFYDSFWFFFWAARAHFWLAACSDQMSDFQEDLSVTSISLVTFELREPMRIFRELNRRVIKPLELYQSPSLSTLLEENFGLNFYFKHSSPNKSVLRGLPVIIKMPWRRPPPTFSHHCFAFEWSWRSFTSKCSGSRFKSGLF